MTAHGAAAGTLPKPRVSISIFYSVFFFTASAPSDRQSQSHVRDMFTVHIVAGRVSEFFFFFFFTAAQTYTRRVSRAAVLFPSAATAPAVCGKRRRATVAIKINNAGCHL